MNNSNDTEQPRLTSDAAPYEVKPPSPSQAIQDDSDLEDEPLPESQQQCSLDDEGCTSCQ